MDVLRTILLPITVAERVRIHAQVAADAAGKVSGAPTGRFATIPPVVATFIVVVFPVTITMSSPNDHPVCEGAIVRLHGTSTVANPYDEEDSVETAAKLCHGVAVFLALLWQSNHTKVATVSSLPHPDVSGG